MRPMQTPPQPAKTATPILEIFARIIPTIIPSKIEIATTTHPTVAEVLLVKKVEYMKSRERKMKANIPTKKSTGLKSFLPKIARRNPTMIRMTANTYVYLDKNAQIALIETTGQPALDWI